MKGMQVDKSFQYREEKGVNLPAHQLYKLMEEMSLNLA